MPATFGVCQAITGAHECSRRSKHQARMHLHDVPARGQHGPWKPTYVLLLRDQSDVPATRPGMRQSQEQAGGCWPGLPFVLRFSTPCICDGSRCCGACMHIADVYPQPGNGHSCILPMAGLSIPGHASSKQAAFVCSPGRSQASWAGRWQCRPQLPAQRPRQGAGGLQRPPG